MEIELDQERKEKTGITERNRDRERERLQLFSLLLGNVSDLVKKNGPFIPESTDLSNNVILSISLFFS